MTPSDRARLLKFCRLLASDQDGERGTAASMANKLAERLGGWDKVLTGAAEQPNDLRQPNNHWRSGTAAEQQRNSFYDETFAQAKAWSDRYMDAEVAKAKQQSWDIERLKREYKARMKQEPKS